MTETKFDDEAFEAWWHNEGSAGPTNEQVGMDREEWTQMRAKEAWLNGAFKARQKRFQDNKCTCQGFYKPENCPVHGKG